jgi:hypothetical protein
MSMRVPQVLYRLLLALSCGMAQAQPEYVELNPPLLNPAEVSRFTTVDHPEAEGQLGRFRRAAGRRLWAGPGELPASGQGP